MTGRKRVAPTSLENLKKGNMVRHQTYNPTVEHAEIAFASLDQDLQVEALLGSDERNFKSYDSIEFSSLMEDETAKWLVDERVDAVVDGASKEEIMDDFAEMGILFVDPNARPKRAVRNKAKVADEEAETSDSAGDDGAVNSGSEIKEPARKRRKL